MSQYIKHQSQQLQLLRDEQEPDDDGNLDQDGNFDDWSATATARIRSGWSPKEFHTRAIHAKRLQRSLWRSLVGDGPLRRRIAAVSQPVSLTNSARSPTP